MSSFPRGKAVGVWSIWHRR